MIVQTTRFGDMEIADEKLVEFPFGLPGFPDLTRWCLLHPEGYPIIHWLQSTEATEVALIIADPEALFPDYDVQVEAEDLAPIGVVLDESTDELPPIVLRVVLSINSDIGKLTANLRAPLLFNLDTRLAIQLPLINSDYSVREPMPATGPVPQVAGGAGQPVAVSGGTAQGSSNVVANS